ncbi:MAG: flagellar basal body P-ring protein FlgI [Gammaproteobacteria bacterium]|nr:flagellar basal body P-ring protein FlgI [Gammaproteobacteria bacterium]MBQ0839511.1 flagellar basal body P-ring protein FlgI [Gammaproteobacteria bacterium]
MSIQKIKRFLKCQRLPSFVAALLLCAALPAAAERLKDIASIAGVRSNHLVGYGLVIGLNGSGDSTNSAPFTVQSLKSMLAKFGVVVPPGVNPSLKNVAAVMVHAQLPPFAKPGQTIDITVSSIANAKSLRGGSLLMAPLKGADGQTYAIAQGNMVVGGFGAEGGDGSSVTVNIPSVGRIPNGATVERSVPTPFSQAGPLVLNLKTPDFTTAMRVAEKINAVVGDGTALPIDSTSIQVQAPANQGQKVAFLAMLQAMDVTPGEAPARVIVNARTGTIVIDSHVRVMPVAVAHGSLTVSVSESLDVSQPGAFARRGRTVVTPSSDVAITQENNPMFLLGKESGVSLEEVVRAVNNIGAAPGDMVSILEALKQAGALRAELIVI